MKKIYIILFPMVLISCALYVPPADSLPSVEPTTEMIDGADRILLTVDESPEEAYRNFVKFLSDHGFGFDNTDRELMIIKTDNKEVKNYSYSINSFISEEDDKTVIQISGNGHNPKLGNFEIRNTGPRLSHQKVSWKEMYTLASSYPHMKIMYKRN